MEILDWAAKYAGVIQILLLLLFGAALIWLRATFVPRTEFREVIERIEEELDVQGKRLDDGAQHFGEIRHLLEAAPTQEDFLTITQGLTETTGSIKVLVERIEGLKNIVERVERQVTRHESIFSDAARSARS